MYPAYAKWIRSHRDLPLLLNQWTSVVRWEFKYPTPFIRTREFLWQEGHTAHATMKDAEIFTLKLIDLYKEVYEKLLACPVIQGVKSEKEKFAGGYMTTTVENFIPTNGRAVQGATSHHLGENFAKMFNINYEDDKGNKQNVAQTSWAVTTRSLGTMIMIHGDNSGLVLPPRVAETQLVIVPIPGKKIPIEELVAKSEALRDALTDENKGMNVRVEVDSRVKYSPGWKFNHWELKGVPIRVELGEKDMEKGVITVATRYDKYDPDYKKFTMEIGDLGKTASELKTLLDTIQTNMLDRATKTRNEAIVKCVDFQDMVKNLDRKVLFLCPWCETTESEEEIKKLTKEISEKAALEQKAVQQQQQQSLEENGEVFQPALSGAIKTLCIPLEQPAMPTGQMCFFDKSKKAKRWCLMGRSY